MVTAASYAPAELAQFVIEGLADGLVIGLVALGFTATFNSSGILNFAQGAFVMLGGMLTYLFFSHGWPLLGAGLMAAAIATAASVVSYYGLVFPLQRRQATPFTVLIALFGVHLLAENVVLRTIGSSAVGYPQFSDGRASLLGVTINYQVFWIAGLAVALMALLAAFFGASLTGRAWRAAAADPIAARLMGIRVNRMVMYAFALSGLLGAAAGVLITPLEYTQFNVGLTYAVTGFAAAMIGGLGNMYGAVAGGLILGVAQSLAVAYLPSGYKDVVAFALLYIILVVRPSGLFGSLVEHDR